MLKIQFTALAAGIALFPLFGFASSLSVKGSELKKQNFFEVDITKGQITPSIQESAEEPIRYVGGVQPDKRYYDGAIPHAVGVHRYQVLRANRTRPPEGGLTGWTYNHQPYLAYWNGRFFLQYLSNLRGESIPPGRTLLLTSDNGRDWSAPQVIFPEYALPEINNEEGHLPAGTPAVMHQRMGFYTAPNGRLLTLAFYGFVVNPLRGPNTGQGLGRVVREIYLDNTLGPIYFIRFNRHAGWNEDNTKYPYYKTSDDAGFVEACKALLQDNLITLQWWEEDRADDGFFAFEPEEGVNPRAFCFTHRPDGSVLGVWKMGLAALSSDGGNTWTNFAQSPTLKPCGGKIWIQRTQDDRYALVYNHSVTRTNRFPLVIMTSKNCRDFNTMLCLHGEVPPMRYTGLFKNLGPQYVRGILEGNGNPPGSFLWLTYSVNKEDIWVSRTRIPVIEMVTEHVNENFNDKVCVDELELWNLYQPLWARIGIVQDPHNEDNSVLELRDEEPYDYALAERTFPEESQIQIEFRVLAKQIGHGVLEIEIQDRQGRRPLKLRLDEKRLWTDQTRRWIEPILVPERKWLHIKLEVDCQAGHYNLFLNGKHMGLEVPLAEKVESVNRLIFRTGPWRGDVRALYIDGQHETLGFTQEDLPGADQRVPLSVYLIDDVKTM